MSVLTKVLGDPNAREVKRHLERVADISELEPLIEKLSDDELRAKTAELRQRLENGEALDDLLVEAFAVVREASRLSDDGECFRQQLIEGLAIGGSLPEFDGLAAQLLVRQRLNRRFEGVDLRHDRAQPFQFAFVLGSDDFGEKSIEHLW